jgi:hypothetical protein
MKAKNKISAYSRIFWIWCSAFWSIALVVVGGYFYFSDAIVQSVESTPHPALVYLIFGTAAVSTILLAYTLSRFVGEERLLVRFHNLTHDEHKDLMANLRWKPDLLPVYRLLADLNRGSIDTRASAFENELVAAEDRILSRLTLANYLGGALVGLGLVGTFIGLLDTLNDLGKIFDLLVNVGSKDIDPVAMFGNMITKLQEPMRGMSTAFVASLYGLMGSLVIGLVVLSVRQVGLNLCKEARELLKSNLYADGIPDVAVTTAVENLSPIIDKALQAIPVGIEALVNTQGAMLEQNRQLLQEHRTVVTRMDTVERELTSIRNEVLLQVEQQHKMLSALKAVNLKKPLSILVFSAGITCLSVLVLVIWMYQRFSQVQTAVANIQPAAAVVSEPAVPKTASEPVQASSPASEVSTSASSTASPDTAAAPASLAKSATPVTSAPPKTSKASKTSETPKASKASKASETTKAAKSTKATPAPKASKAASSTTAATTSSQLPTPNPAPLEATEKNGKAVDSPPAPVAPEAQPKACVVERGECAGTTSADKSGPGAVDKGSDSTSIPQPGSETSNPNKKMASD